ncbi:MAG: GNAT family N-acetyltransferase [Proteobacteria bacterium]|nr:GNAT family N-acetyltransferase [Pseudomonadota bacterium]
MTEFFIRVGRAGDEDAIYSLLHDLAEYEKLLDKFQITREVIVRDYLSENPLCHVDIAFEGEKPAGVMSWYWIYTSFAAARGIYLEDLFVRPQFRGKGYGKKLLAHLTKRAVAAKASRVEWSVLDWNKPSIEFYELLGARRHDGWFTYRLTDEALADLAKG